MKITIIQRTPDRGAGGTDADVSARFIGTTGEFPEGNDQSGNPICVLLDKPNRNLRERNDTDRFVLSSPKDLGQFVRLIIKFVPMGPAPAWQCGTQTVQFGNGPAIDLKAEGHAPGDFVMEAEGFYSFVAV